LLAVVTAAEPVRKPAVAGQLLSVQWHASKGFWGIVSGPADETIGATPGLLSWMPTMTGVGTARSS
jgi:hypothetical protein